MRPYEGKAKRMTLRSATEVEVFFKDDATAFNGQKHQVFPGKGELNSQISELFFVHLEKQGVKTQHLKRLDERTLLARAAKMFALEVVVRFKIEGSLQKRTGLPVNSPCVPPVVELYFKRDDLGDPIINDDHVRLLGIATPAELDELRSLARKAAAEVHAVCERAGIDLVDMKFEFGRTDQGILLVDEISPDTCRFRDKATGAILDKDRFRRDQGDLLEGYREVLRRLQTALKGS